ncbi:MAG TPA: helix-turn-helix transcriptional regulator [Actinopolymorphaceae bacterium]|jgi:AraC-like DNA-binding protein
MQSSSAPGREIVIAAARFLREHSSQRIKLCDVADHVGYSPFHLARVFEQHMGTTPGQFLAAHRFHRAKDLLLHSDERIIDVCLAVGFTSVGTFTTRFTASVGLSPTAFRRLPDLLAAAPPQPMTVPGDAAHGCVVSGSVRLSERAHAALRGCASIYVGLYRKRSARGVPISGSLLDESHTYALTGLRPGRYWLLAAALPQIDDPVAQLLPSHSVIGSSPTSITLTRSEPLQHHDLVLDVAEDWRSPVVVALPPLAAPIVTGTIA